MVNLSSEFEWKIDLEEDFYFLARRWDVSKAKRMIVDKPREVVNANLDGIAKFVKRPKDGQITLGVTIEWSKIDEKPEEFDCDFPSILITTSEGTFPIDGWHRFAKGIEEGRTVFPCVILDEAETKDVTFR